MSRASNLAGFTTTIGGSNLNVGIVTATRFVGDGSNITNVSAVGSIAVNDNGSSAGAAATTLNFSTNLNVSTTAVGIVTVTVGDTDFEIADKIVHTGDTNTAIRFPAADTVTVETAGSERLRITSDGKIAIGTTIPETTGALTVSMSDTNEKYLTLINRQNWGYGVGIDFMQPLASGGSVIKSGKILSDWESANNSLLSFYTTGSGTLTERLRIDSSGRVGLGTLSPSTSLHVRGSNTNGKGQFIIQSASAGQEARMTFIDGSDDIAEISTDGNNLYFYNETATGAFQWYTNNTERLRIDASGRLLLGATSTNYSNTKLLVAGTAGTNYISLLNTTATDSDEARFSYLHFRGTQSGGEVSSLVSIGAQHDGSGDDQKGELTFRTNDGSDGNSPTERMRITSQGRIQANTVTQFTGEKYHFYNDENLDGMVINENTTQNYTALHIRHGRGGLSGFSGKAVSFRGNDSSEEGSIVINTTSVSYNTSSDYRLKENQQSITDGIDRLKQLSPYRFNFIKDPGVVVDGFFAHEAQTVVPESVTGDKDGEEMQSIDHSKLVPLLTAALQESITKIETLEAKVAALEGL